MVLQRILTVGLFTLLLMSASLPSLAAWTRGSGSAPIVGVDIDQARHEAIRNALREVALAHSVRVSSREHMVDGEIREDRLTISSEARIKSIRLLREERRGDIYHVEVEAQVMSGSQCDGQPSAHLRKRVAFTAFPLATPGQASLGQWHDVSGKLSALLYTHLQHSPAVQPFAAHGQRLYPEGASSPTLMDPASGLHKHLDIVREMGVQYVVSGVVREIAAEDTEGDGPSSFTQSLRKGATGWLFGNAGGQRRMVVDLVVLDGFTGLPLLEQTFSWHGEWPLPAERRVEFGSSEFFATPFGGAAGAQIQEMARAVERAVRCQPFITRILQVDGRRVYVTGGAVEGLRPGDTLSVYVQGDAFRTGARGFTLGNVRTQVELSSVYPTYSEGLLSGEADQFNIQAGEALIIW